MAQIPDGVVNAEMFNVECSACGFVHRRSFPRRTSFPVLAKCDRCYDRFDGERSWHRVVPNPLL